MKRKKMEHNEERELEKDAEFEENELKEEFNSDKIAVDIVLEEGLDSDEHDWDYFLPPDELS